MWVIGFMIAFVAPLFIMGGVAAWREKQFDKERENEEIALQQGKKADAN